MYTYDGRLACAPRYRVYEPTFLTHRQSHLAMILLLSEIRLMRKVSVLPKVEI